MGPWSGPTSPWWPGHGLQPTPLSPSSSVYSSLLFTSRRFGPHTAACPSPSVSELSHRPRGAPAIRVVLLPRPALGAPSWWPSPTGATTSATPPGSGLVPAFPPPLQPQPRGEPHAASVHLRLLFRGLRRARKRFHCVHGLFPVTGSSPAL